MQVDEVGGGDLCEMVDFRCTSRLERGLGGARVGLRRAVWRDAASMGPGPRRNALLRMVGVYRRRR